MKIAAHHSKQALMLLFCIWPFAAFGYASYHIRNPKWHFIWILFFALFGYCVFFSPGDILGYKESFYFVSRYTWGDFTFHLTHLISSDRLIRYEMNTVNSQPDFYAFSLQFIISRFTDNSRWFFAVVNLVFAYFFLQFIKEVLAETTWNKTLFQRVFFLLLFLIVPFYVAVTGVRFWTALFIFMYYAIKHIRKNDLYSLFFAATSIFVHYSFFIPVLLLLIYKLIVHKKVITWTLLIFSILFFALSSANSSLAIIQNVTAAFSETSLKDRTSSYTDSADLDMRKKMISEMNWYVKYRANAILYFLLLLFLLEYAGIIKWNKSPFLERLEPFYLILFCLTLITTNLGSLGRFMYLFYLVSFLRLTIIAGLNANTRTLKIVGYIAIPILVMHVFVIGRAGFYFVDPLMLISNPITMMLTRSNVSLSEFLVGH
ncbi:MAG: EpsG family protein [Ferruginibacter sp.]